MTEEEFMSWWNAGAVEKGKGTIAHMEAWKQFCDAFDKQHGISDQSIRAVPPHAREQLMAAFALIFG